MLSLHGEDAFENRIRWCAAGLYTAAMSHCIGMMIISHDESLMGYVTEVS